MLRGKDTFVDQSAHAGGASELVQLEPDHPGFNDVLYRRRRNMIAELALGYTPGNPVPTIEYTDVEHRVWAEVWRHLGPLHERYACSRYRDLGERVPIDRQRIPQLAAINDVLETLYGYTMLPVAGLVSARTFLGYLADGIFLSTQYIRHHSMPLYTPEPDICHELIGHAVTFADPAFCRLNRAFGNAAKRARDSHIMDRIGRLYWYTLEFGVVQEPAGLKVYGAGLLSSFGELGRFERETALQPFDIGRVADTPYDPTTYQHTLFVAEDFDALSDELIAWLEEC